MKTTLLVGCVFLFAIAHLTCSTIEGGATGSSMGTFQNIFDISWASGNWLDTIIAVATIPFTFVWALFKMLLFLDYGTIFQGDWVWARTLLLWPLSVGMIYAIIMSLKGTPST